MVWLHLVAPLPIRVSGFSICRLRLTFLFSEIRRIASVGYAAAEICSGGSMDYGGRNKIPCMHRPADVFRLAWVDSPPNPGSLFYVLRYPNGQRGSKCVLAQGALSLYGTWGRGGYLPSYPLGIAERRHYNLPSLAKERNPAGQINPAMLCQQEPSAAETGSSVTQELLRATPRSGQMRRRAKYGRHPSRACPGR
jgi:hypothetical protein